MDDLIARSISKGRKAYSSIRMIPLLLLWSFFGVLALADDSTDTSKGHSAKATFPLVIPSFVQGIVTGE